MRIVELSLKNFRCFEAYTLGFAPRFSLLIGENGSGKTVMLDALTVAAGLVPSRDSWSCSAPIGKDDIHAIDLVLGQTPTPRREKAGESEVSAKGDIKGTAARMEEGLRSAPGRATPTVRRQHSGNG